MSQPTREEVEAFISALRYGMKVSHKPEFLIALASGWLQYDSKVKEAEDVIEGVCASGHDFDLAGKHCKNFIWMCKRCGKITERPNF